jgi:hypothetical protein
MLFKYGFVSNNGLLNQHFRSPPPANPLTASFSAYSLEVAEMYDIQTEKLMESAHELMLAHLPEECCDCCPVINIHEQIIIATKSLD